MEAVVGAGGDGGGQGADLGVQGGGAPRPGASMEEERMIREGKKANERIFMRKKRLNHLHILLHPLVVE